MVKNISYECDVCKDNNPDMLHGIVYGLNRPIKTDKLENAELHFCTTCINHIREEIGKSPKNPKE